ncbi:MAG: hypothetical protein O7C59_05150 [Rickettsia endosymbiont of Ixodes persulcatus]|nr:hypothetical protein [Rickettsia endosymbiont of Ixodes persulcatus]MCZ6902460.1 hypothetical protein [Rickettsia endosymbiont of Ixodes persulcatus]MCZ6902977.1 hypothetical protein [Rickettsia endosymbiont of Ixodes persulcatus]MCZ6908817.1 hypothetical protein [Rickettsia endosymbiont of Ixodes persulcatus]MCZ6910894.1 hypothetical protein [Rickettsia endosymbiont of Ixodes persulcatus]
MSNPHLTEGNNHFKNGGDKEAREAAYSKIDKSSTSYPYVLFNIGEFYFQQEKFIEAIEAYNKVNKNHYLFEKANSNISDIEKNFNLIEYILKEKTNSNILCIGENFDLINIDILNE